VVEAIEEHSVEESLAQIPPIVSRQTSYDPEIFVVTGNTFVEGDITSLSIRPSISDIKP
jgi:hypothetical protein